MGVGESKQGKWLVTLFPVAEEEGKESKLNVHVTRHALCAKMLAAAAPSLYQLGPKKFGISEFTIQIRSLPTLYAKHFNYIWTKPEQLTHNQLNHLTTV